MTDTLLHFVHISDTHLSPDPSYTSPLADYPAMQGAEALVERLNHLPVEPDFVLHTGDVVYEPDAAAYASARAILGKIRYPVYYLAGNHDEGGALQRDLMGLAQVKRPFYYEFEVNGVQVACLDSNGPATPPAGFVTEEQLAWLEALCRAEDDRPLVVAVHHNVLPVGVPWLDEYMGMTNGEDFHRALLPARERLRGVFTGHTHQHMEVYQDGILYSGVLSSWFQLHAWPGQVETMPDRKTQPGFTFVTITPEQTFLRRHQFEV